MLRPFRALIGNNHLTQGFALGWYVNAPFGAESWNKTRVIAFSKKHEFSSPQLESRITLCFIRASLL